ncbi:MAG: C25 family cysteine peptidase, partial [Proteobacteria bacterium]|nr:C25 family cysteine peptidase [Pseudomonadota bacterium]
YDYHNILGLNAISYIPTIYAATDDLISYAPVDAKYADIDNDNIPDIALGRLPVRTEADLTVMLNKIYAYDQKDYAKTALISADEYDTSQGYSFTSDANQIINSLPLDWQNNLTLAYMDADGLNLAQSKIINGINAGVALTSFVGHSGTRAWSFSRLLKNSHVNALINSDKPTLVTQWGCWNTYFVSPQENTMAHAFMLNPNGGAVASLGASTLTKAATERALSQLFIENLINKQQTLGEAVKNAKIQLSQSQPDALDVILGWNIMGDPTIKL